MAYPEVYPALGRRRVIDPTRAKEVYDSADYFDRVGEHDYASRLPYYHELSCALVETLHPEISLDVGCEGGDLVYAFAVQGTAAYGIDLSAYAIAHGIEAVRDNMSQSKAECLPFPDNTFDLVTSHHVVEHLETPSIFIREMRRVLKDSGSAFIVTTIPPLGTPKPWRWLGIQKDITHVSLHSRAWWIGVFEGQGFKYVGNLDNIVSIQAPGFWVGRLLMKLGPLGPTLAKVLHSTIRGSFLFKLEKQRDLL
jgi:ubiquinone/menaquinone biosynthesis C-methylase UbiE